MPAVFAYGLEPDAGPGLVFITLPMIFAQLSGGSVVAVIFYFCLFVAALTSAISLLEVTVAFLQNECRFSRRAAVFLCFAALFILGSVSALSFGPWNDCLIFGRSIFDFLDYVCTIFLMTINGLAVAFVVGWKAWPKAMKELSTCSPENGVVTKGTLSAIGFGLRWLAPLMVLASCWQGLEG